MITKYKIASGRPYMFFFGIVPFVFFVHYTSAQNSENVFLGTLIVDGGQAYSYRLQFTDSAKTINGYSITDINRPDHTKATITGSINPIKKEVVFEERQLLFTRSKQSRDSFCFVSARLKLTKLKGTSILKGRFTGYMKNGRICAKGHIVLADKHDVLDKLMTLGKEADTLIKLIKLKEDKLKDSTGVVNTDTVARNDTLDYIAPGARKELLCRDKNVFLELWDAGKIDGDILTISFNNTTLLHRYLLRGDVKRFSLELSPSGIDTITITANNEGAESPNTARLKVTSGKDSWQIDAGSTIEKPVQLILRQPLK